RDGLMLVIDKPAGIPVHAGPGGGPNIEDGFDSLKFGLPKRPHLAHRLDRDTSGCLVLGRHTKALSRLGKLFESKRIEKTYLAILPIALEGNGVIDASLAKVHKWKGWKMKVAEPGDEGAQETITDYKVLHSEGGQSLVAFYPKTGRTHQIRVHALHAFGAAILGDTLYGTDEDKKQPRLYLHASAITLPLYPKKDPITVEAPIPAEFLALPVVDKWVLNL
ncbi:MAG TPA: RNA pseudouridine synthase, partial [Alphaproteobacteria bacterium]